MSGSRLPGDSESDDRHKADVRADTRLKGNLAERFERHVEDTGEHKADVLRAALDEFLPSLDETGDEWVTPDDPDLRAAYLALATEDRKRVLAVEVVVDRLARTSHPSTSKESIRHDVLPALDETPFVGVRFGQVGVRRLTTRSEVLAP